jgi:hypothetical protein
MGKRFGDIAVSNQVEQVERAHSRWHIWQAEESRQWWASVRVNLTPNQERAGCVPHLTAATLPALKVLLQEEDQRAQSASSHAPTVPVRAQLWGVTEADIDYALRKAKAGEFRRTWEFATIERLSGIPCPLDMHDPKAIAAEQGYHWAYVVYPHTPTGQTS